MPFFSIIIPTYNRAHLISKAINSVLEQTETDWELIVVDDGSTDDTKAVVEQFDDARVSYVFQENAERSAARNNGVRHAKGQYICFLDSDDYYIENHLAVFKQVLEKENYQKKLYVSESFHEIDGQRNRIRINPGEYSNLPLYFFKKSIITPIMVCIPKALLIENTFLERYKKGFWEDTHVWIRIICKYAIAFTNEATCVIREHTGRSIYHKKSVSLVNLEDHINMIKELETNHAASISSYITADDFKLYYDQKYRMYLYQARQNKQVRISTTILFKALLNRPSFYLLSEFPKLLLNAIGVGIHE